MQKEEPLLGESSSQQMKKEADQTDNVDHTELKSAGSKSINLVPENEDDKEKPKEKEKKKEKDKMKKPIDEEAEKYDKVIKICKKISRNLWDI